MARGVKFVAAGGEVRSKKVAAEEKGKRAALRTREAMDFDPKSRVLRGQKEVDEYLASYDVRLPFKIEVEWCTPEDQCYSLASCWWLVLSSSNPGSRGEAPYDSFCQGCLSALQGPTLIVDIGGMADCSGI